MTSDEREIRTVHAIWMEAVNAGDLARLLTLVAEDVVFLSPGDGEAEKAEKIATAKREHGLAEGDVRQVIVVRFGRDCLVKL